MSCTVYADRKAIKAKKTSGSTRPHNVIISDDTENP